MLDKFLTYEELIGNQRDMVLAIDVKIVPEKIVAKLKRFLDKIGNDICNHKGLVEIS